VTNRAIGFLGGSLETPLFLRFGSSAQCRSSSFPRSGKACHEPNSFSLPLIPYFYGTPNSFSPPPVHNPPPFLSTPHRIVSSPMPSSDAFSLATLPYFCTESIVPRFPFRLQVLKYLSHQELDIVPPHQGRISHSFPVAWPSSPSEFSLPSLPTGIAPLVGSSVSDG